jgi:GTPase SAR1 family protein
MRVMIVGPGAAGKTTLVERLLTDEFSTRQFSMTDGVSIKEWKPAPEMNLSLWDFGGQQVYLNTHAMLFSDKTLYLLVWNPRAGTDPRVLEEYLLNIRSRSKTNPIMLVTTHGSSIQESETHLSKHNCLSHHSVDSSDGMGIAELKQSIVKFVSEDWAEHSLVTVPGWSTALESKLKELAQSKFSIDRVAFQSMCYPLWKSSREDQDKDKGKRGDPDDAAMDCEQFLQAVKTALALFHHWGVVFVLKKSSSVSAHDHDKHGDANEIGKGDEECGDIVLNPQRLADVFKCVITCHVDSTGDEKKSELFQEGTTESSQFGLATSLACALNF